MKSWECSEVEGEDLAGAGGRPLAPSSPPAAKCLRQGEPTCRLRSAAARYPGAITLCCRPPAAGRPPSPAAGSVLLVMEGVQTYGGDDSWGASEPEELCWMLQANKNVTELRRM